MNEEDAKAWLLARFDQGAVERLEAFKALLIEESQNQNLIASSTMASFWARHVVDSAQLITLAAEEWRAWIDVGTGAGFPGLVVALLIDRPVTMVEPRRLRADFLSRCADHFGLADARVLQTSVEKVRPDGAADIISARAVASASELLTKTEQLFSPRTTFLLPKGAKAYSEVEALQATWQGKFHVEQSTIEPSSGIIVATGVKRR